MERAGLEFLFLICAPSAVFKTEIWSTELEHQL